MTPDFMDFLGKLKARRQQQPVSPATLASLINPEGQAVPGGLIPSSAQPFQVPASGVVTAGGSPFRGANTTQALINFFSLLQRKRRADEFARKQREKEAKAQQSGAK